MKSRPFTLDCAALAALVIAVATSTPGCGGSSAESKGFAGKPNVKATRNPDGSINDHSRCEYKNRPDREATETAGPGALQPNVRRVWQLIGQGEARSKVLVCREIDTNFDGVKDVVRRYNDKGEPLHEETDSNHDGRIDTWLTYSKGRVAEERRDNNHDGKPDEWKFWTNGKLMRARRDTDFNGRPDVWEIYRDGKLERMGVDLDGDERVDRWDHDTEMRKKIEEEERKKDEAQRARAEEARKAGEYRTADPSDETAADGADAKAGDKTGDKKDKRKPAAKKAAEKAPSAQ